jgi:hypothetical protein
MDEDQATPAAEFVTEAVCLRERRAYHFFLTGISALLFAITGLSYDASRTSGSAERWAIRAVEGVNGTREMMQTEMTFVRDSIQRIDGRLDRLDGKKVSPIGDVAKGGAVRREP